MVRSRWIGAAFGLWAWTGLASGQQPPPPAAATTDRILSVQESGKAAQKYRVLKSWKRADGATVYQVQSLSTNEIMTLIDPPASGAKPAAPETPAAVPPVKKPVVEAPPAVKPHNVQALTPVKST